MNGNSQNMMSTTCSLPQIFDIRDSSSNVVKCQQNATCPFIHCYHNILCLIYDTTAHVLSDCRLSNRRRPIYCVCPSINPHDDHKKFRLFNEMSSTTSAASSTITTAMTDDNSLPGWAIAVIVIAVCIFVALLAVGAFFLVRKIRERRKNHGEYRPQYEEYQHAKDLPYLPPPAIEGLI